MAIHIQYATCVSVGQNLKSVEKPLGIDRYYRFRMRKTWIRSFWSCRRKKIFEFFTLVPPYGRKSKNFEVHKIFQKQHIPTFSSTGNPKTKEFHSISCLDFVICVGRFFFRFFEKPSFPKAYLYEINVLSLGFGQYTSGRSCSMIFQRFRSFFLGPSKSYWSIYGFISLYGFIRILWVHRKISTLFISRIIEFSNKFNIGFLRLNP